mmetsp:Transcript_17147/g.47721  ORF Transcript_17147/g.47721 Transcript_17147/m.47721 type:complete len:281 (+) Transcript_17147:233-1075(+)
MKDEEASNDSPRPVLRSSRLAAASFKTAWSSDAVTPHLPRDNPGEPADVFCIRFSPDDELVAAGCGDGILRIYNANNGKLVHSLCDERLILPTTCLRFRPHGSAAFTKNVLVEANSDGTIKHGMCPRQSACTPSPRTIIRFTRSTSTLWAAASQPPAATAISASTTTRLSLSLSRLRAHSIECHASRPTPCTRATQTASLAYATACSVICSSLAAGTTPSSSGTCVRSQPFSPSTVRTFVVTPSIWRAITSSRAHGGTRSSCSSGISARASLSAPSRGRH